jgi:sulfur-carrier protein
MALKVKFVGALRHLSGKTQLTLNYTEKMSLKQLIDSLSEQYPAIKHTFTDQTLNDAKSNSLVLINGREISVLDGYETKLSDGDEVVFVPVVHGG